MDDEFDNIDFSAIDQLVENHQAKQQVRETNKSNQNTMYTCFDDS